MPAHCWISVSVWAACCLLADSVTDITQEHQKEKPEPIAVGLIVKVTGTKDFEDNLQGVVKGQSDKSGSWKVLMDNDQQIHKFKADNLLVQGEPAYEQKVNSYLQQLKDNQEYPIDSEGKESFVPFAPNWNVEGQNKLTWKEKFAVVDKYLNAPVCSNVAGGASSEYPCRCGTRESTKQVRCAADQLCTATTPSDGECKDPVVNGSNESSVDEPGQTGQPGQPGQKNFEKSPGWNRMKVYLKDAWKVAVYFTKKEMGTACVGLCTDEERGLGGRYLKDPARVTLIGFQQSLNVGGYKEALDTEELQNKKWNGKEKGEEKLWKFHPDNELAKKWKKKNEKDDWDSFQKQWATEAFMLGLRLMKARAAEDDWGKESGEVRSSAADQPVQFKDKVVWVGLQKWYDQKWRRPPIVGDVVVDNTKDNQLGSGTLRKGEPATVTGIEYTYEKKSGAPKKEKKKKEIRIFVRNAKGEDSNGVSLGTESFQYKEGEVGLDRHAFAYAWLFAYAMQFNLLSRWGYTTTTPLDEFFGPAFLGADKKDNYGLITTTNEYDEFGPVAKIRSKLWMYRQFAGYYKQNPMEKNIDKAMESKNDYTGYHEENYIYEPAFIRFWHALKSEKMQYENLEDFHELLRDLYWLALTMGWRNTDDAWFRVFEHHNGEVVHGSAFQYMSLIAEEYACEKKPVGFDRRVPYPDSLSLLKDQVEGVPDFPVRQ